MKDLHADDLFFCILGFLIVAMVISGLAFDGCTKIRHDTVCAEMSETTVEYAECIKELE